ncbi:TPA: HAD family hydrolase [Thermoplasmata archaeon]|nr:HAD family hydrolase [Thermoplasmata archaeon]
MGTVTFDLWDTLIQEVPGGSLEVARIRMEKISDILKARGRPHPMEEIGEAYAKTGSFLDLAWGKCRDMTVRDQVLFMLSCIEWRLPSKLGNEGFSEVEEAYAVSMLEHRPILLPDAKGVLEEVRSMGLRLGLVSNTGRTPGSILRTVIKDQGILEYFDVTTFSDEVLVRKPAQAIFRTTLEGLRAPPRASLHVGDDPRADVDGAKDCGMMAVQVRTEKQHSNARADAHAQRLKDVVGIVDSLRR